eukprot:scaffold28934_cov31-Tisochrysis_lutea.AAC.2
MDSHVQSRQPIGGGALGSQHILNINAAVAHGAAHGAVPTAHRLSRMRLERLPLNAYSTKCYHKA